MELVYYEAYEFDGRIYDLKVGFDGDKWIARAFLDGAPANPYRYTIDVMTAVGLRRSLGVAAIDLLIDFAKEDIREQTWDKYKEVMREDAHREETCKRLRDNHTNLSKALAKRQGDRDNPTSQADIDRIMHRMAWLESELRKNGCA